MGGLHDGLSYPQQLGERLRKVRQQQGLSLHDVERRSGGDLKASVLGAYERGERALSVGRLHALADFYRVPVSSLLPDADRANRGRPSQGLRIDLTTLERDTPRARVVDRYITAIQVRRGDYNGRVLTVRETDVETLAAVLDTEPSALRDELLAGGGASARPGP